MNLIPIVGLLFLISGCASTDRPKLEDRITQLEGEIDSLHHQIQVKEDRLVFLAAEKQAGNSTSPDGTPIDLRISQIKVEIDSFKSTRELKTKELEELREELKSAPPPPGHYHPRPRPPRVKYPFPK